MTTTARYYARMIEGTGHDARIYDLAATTRGAAYREARQDYLGGCRVGEGRVELYDVDPRTTLADPFEVIEA